MKSAIDPSRNYPGWPVAFFLLYFGFRLLYLVITISPFVPPDEISHFGICRVFSSVFFLPENSPESYRYGLVTNIPWLYYWIMGKLLHLNFFGISDLVFLRLLNIPFAFATVYFAWRTLRLLTDDRLTQILLIVAMTNTMMFTFISAFVSYDNLTNLLAAMSVYYLLAYFKSRNGSVLAVTCICLLAGSLTKTAFLPIAVIILVALVVREYKDAPRLPGELFRLFRELKWRGIGLVCTILVGLALNLQLYGGNYLHYGKLDLEMYEVLPFESVMKNSLAARNMILTLFQEGRVTREQAFLMASRVENPGERADTIYTVRNYEKYRDSGMRSMGFPAYSVLWAKRMAAGIFGVLGHLAIPAKWPSIAPVAFLAMLTLAAIIIRWRPSDASWFPTYLASIAGFYCTVLLYWVNYRGYLENGAPYLALQGRYLFPVIGPLYVLASYYLMRLFNGRYMRMGIFAAAVLILLICDFPLFLARVSPAWYLWPQN